MASDSSLYVTLPSNTKQFPANKLNSFRVRLPHRIQLEGSGWEVALVEAIYPHSWHNFVAEERDNSELVILISWPYNDNDFTKYYSRAMNIDLYSTHYKTIDDLLDVINDKIRITCH
jgi:hypothetical protein